MADHFQKHPTILFSLSLVRGKSFEEMLESFVGKLSDLYATHSYLCTWLESRWENATTGGSERISCEIKLKQFVKYIDGEIGETEARHGEFIRLCGNKLMGKIRNHTQLQG
jgi:hypothetical protein